MCLVLIASDPRPGIRLAVAANRDEFHARPTAAAAPWPGAPRLVAGRDLEAGGTWLGVTEGGRLAALTNYREGRAARRERSRGELVVEALSGRGALPEFLDALPPRLGSYGAFNLIAGGADGLRIFSSRSGLHEPVPPGVRGLSNADLDTPWPKVRRTKAALVRLSASAEPFDAERLFRLLGDRTPAPDGELPETGVGVDLERFLSPPFIVGPEYGTRSSTVVLFLADGTVELSERSFDPAGRETGTVSWRLGEPKG